MNSIRKLIVLVLILTFTFALPVSTQAVDKIPPIPVSDSILRDKEAGLTIFGFTIPGLTWDSIAIAIAKVALEQILQATTDWVRGGFEGNPAYATDPAQFFTKIADNVAGEFIAGSDLGFLCSPFQTKIRLALQQYYTQRRRFQCSVTGIISNLDAFYNDFSQGGWDGLFVMTQNDFGNPYGTYLQGQVELDRRLARALNIQDKELSWNRGFLSWSECVQEDYMTGECMKRGPVQTPGTVIESQLEGVLGSGMRQLELADEFDELVSALFAQLVKQTVFNVRGLF